MRHLDRALELARDSQSPEVGEVLPLIKAARGVLAESMENPFVGAFSPFAADFGSGPTGSFKIPVDLLNRFEEIAGALGIDPGDADFDDDDDEDFDDFDAEPPRRSSRRQPKKPRGRKRGQ
jgi:hypothetical protein